MKQRTQKMVTGILFLMLLAVTAGCANQNVTPRQSGLSPEAVVSTFFQSVKNDRLAEAGQYISPEIAANQDVIKEFSGQDDLTVLQTATLLNVKKVTEQDPYAVAAATLQTADGGVQVKPVGLEKINGEWYLVPINQIYQQAKYQLLLKLLLSIS